MRRRSTVLPPNGLADARLSCTRCRFDFRWSITSRVSCASQSTTRRGERRPASATSGRTSTTGGSQAPRISTTILPASTWRSSADGWSSTPGVGWVGMRARSHRSPAAWSLLISARAIDQAARNTQEFANVDCVQADLLALPLPDESFDFVYSLGVLHHLVRYRACARRTRAKSEARRAPSRIPLLEEARLAGPAARGRDATAPAHCPHAASRSCGRPAGR